MSAIGPGDWLQCVRAARIGDVSLRVGGVYCVEALGNDDDGECFECGASGPGLDLVGIPRCPSANWCPCAFKPLGGGKTITAPPARVCEPA